ncbi:putative Mg2+ transporter-C (MgtC) family protein [Shimia gijangensis]|uniref:Protein MgtC n=1 Tax=Shimia gijangensis TaxID=1470563 RepID=A0A1M6HRH7_9RHOB|nr:MgtC/SapB family protein [Shimia gijangensis]SHJ24786.1 putative Mg2+ transporter-C (MgtC) family protein [Shimia gijangensis]
MPISLDQAAINLALALLCGAIIGSERQVRQRMAGLRTNALVSIGAAGFVIFSALYPNEVSPTRVAAQVVTGIGFLGAGIIFRHGFTIHGLNTAATLWCSAAVGLMAGAGAGLFALLMTATIVFVNLGLRPLVKWLKRKTQAGQPLCLEYRIRVTSKEKHEQKVRQILVHKLSLPGLSVIAMDVQSEDHETGFDVLVSVEDNSDSILKAAIAPLMIEPSIQSVNWEMAEV